MKKSILITTVLLCCSIYGNQLFSQNEWYENGIFLTKPYLLNTDNNFGTSVAMNDSIIVIGAPNYRSYGGVFVLSNNESLDTLAILMQSEGSGNSDFGISLSLFNDVIVVGSSANAAYVFCKPDGGWKDTTETAVLTNSDGNGGELGRSVCIYEDKIVAGAPEHDTNGYNSGAAYVYVKPDTGWSDMTETAMLLPSVAHSRDLFGTSVSIYKNTIAIAAPENDSTGYDAGIVYIYENSDNNWTNRTETQVLLFSDYGSGGYYGRALCMNEKTMVIGGSSNVLIFEKTSESWNTVTSAKLNLNDEGYRSYYGNTLSIYDSTIAVGLVYHEIIGSDVGATYIYEKPANGWKDTIGTAMLSDDLANVEDHFGSSVCIWKDRIIVGASGDNENGEDAGAAHVFNKPINGWESSNDSKEILPVVHPFNIGDGAGTSIAANGEYLVVGAPGHKDSEGAVFIYSLNNPSEIVATLTASNKDKDDQFGAEVDITDSVIIVGAPYGYNDSINSGTVYLYKMPVNGWKDMTETARLWASNDNELDHFGGSVSIYKDVIAVGATGYISGINNGTVYIFEKPITGWADMNESVKITFEESSNYSAFGCSVSLHDSVLVVGASTEVIDEVETGAAYIYIKPKTGWNDVYKAAKLVASDGDNYDYFGASVSLFENTIAVGATGTDTMFSSSAGTVYVFEKPENGWTNMHQTAKLLPNQYTDGGRFGSSISIYEDKIVIGRPEKGTVTRTGGSAYVFVKPLNGWIDMNETMKINPEISDRLDDFGTSVDIFENSIVIGDIDHDDDYLGRNCGAAYLFTKCEQLMIMDTIACESFTFPNSDSIWTETGTYYYTLANESGCDTLIEIQLTILENSDTTINIYECRSFTSPLSGSIWTSSGIYKEIIPNSAGCDSIINFDLTIADIDVSVNQLDETLTANNSGNSYQWLDCNNDYLPIDGATNNVFIPVISGNYAVEITSSGCVDTSDCYEVTIDTTSSTFINKNDIISNIYPIPASNKLFIEFDNKINSKYNISLINFEGKVIYENIVFSSSYIINLDGISPGIYVIKVNSDTKIISKQIIIQ